MSLTQERINEIAVECWNYYLTNASSFTVTDTYNHFLSRIREEQEPYGYMCEIQDYQDFSFQKKGWPHETPLFTIPPAAPYNGYKEKYLLLSAQYVRDVEQLESACAELVEALASTLRMMDEYSYRETMSGRNNIIRLIEKYKASMGEK